MVKSVVSAITVCLLVSLSARGELKVLSDLRFPEGRDLPGWSFEPGAVKVAGNVLRIQTASGKGHEWAGSTISYRPGFSMENATVRVEVDVASQNLYRDFYLAFFPVGGHAFREPAVTINIDHPDRGVSEVLVRQYEGGARKTVPLKDSRLPFLFDGNVKVTLVLSNGRVSLRVHRGQQQKTFDLGQVIAPKWVIEPFTVEIGTNEHGNAAEPAVVALSGVRILTTRMDENTAAETVGNGPGKDETVTYLDLTPYANRQFEDQTADDRVGGWTDQGSNDMRFIPKGYQYFRNVPFYIADRLAVVGNAPEPGCLVLGSKNNPGGPGESKAIKVDATAAYLYFLQCAAYARAGDHCADYVVTYADGSRETIPLRAGREIGEWWEPKDLPAAVVAWRGKNPVKDDVGFYLFEWQNPHPDKKIASLVFRSTQQAAVPILVAVTAAAKKIEIGAHPRRYYDEGYTICEYRDRIKTAPAFDHGPSTLTLSRTLPIAKESRVRQARIDVIRYRAVRAARVTCTVAGVTKTIDLKPGELRAEFLFTEKGVGEYLTEHKSAFTVKVAMNDPDGIGAYRFETNPNHDWIPAGEDFAHGAYTVTGVYMVTPFLPYHKLSGYAENRPRGVTALPTVKEEAALKPATGQPDWLGSRMCLNSIWQWQPGGRKGYVASESSIPAAGWQEIIVPVDVGPLIFEKDKECISAWFKKDLVIPGAWRDKRVVLQFESVADFATVFCNGKKQTYHEGVAAFDVDLTQALNFGERNTLVVFAENVYKGIIPYKATSLLREIESAVVPYKGHAYRLEMLRGAWDQKPDEIELLVDGKDVGRKAGSIDEVVRTGDGRYYRQLEWNTSYLYFSTPGNADPKALRNRLAIRYYQPGVFMHQGRPEASHEWNSPRPRTTGLSRDVYLSVTGRSQIADVFVRTSVRKMQIEAAVEFKDVPAGAVVTATVRDGPKTVVDLGSRSAQAGAGRVSFGKAWKDPQIWRPENPYLYFLDVELKDGAGMVLDRRFARFGFREFWIEGPDFVFNGQKPFYLQNTSIGGWLLPMHRVNIRWQYLDLNQQANINIIRWHVFGSLYPETAEVADEMGMLLQPEDPFFCPPWVFDDTGRIRFDKMQTPIRWTTDAMRRMRNSPSVVMWGADNEHEMDTQPEKITPAGRDMAEALLRLNAAIKAMDPTRPIVNNGDSILALCEYWKDPRVDTIDGHYVPLSFFADWRERYGKPCTTGEESMGGPYGWTYQGEVRGYLLRGEDPGPYFYRAMNAATNFLADRIQAWKKIGLAGVCPFAFQQHYNPFLLSWEGVHYWGATPDVPWPARSGEGRTPQNFSYECDGSYNCFDPKAPRIYQRTFNAVRDHFDEVPKLQPRLSPEVVIEVVDVAGKPVRDALVWLIPTDQPGTPYGLMTDANGRAWFWCRSGPGTYTAYITTGGRSYQTRVTPAPPGEWLQVKTVRCRLPEGGPQARCTAKEILS